MKRIVLATGLVAVAVAGAGYAARPAEVNAYIDRAQPVVRSAVDRVSARNLRNLFRGSC